MMPDIGFGAARFCHQDSLAYFDPLCELKVVQPLKLQFSH